ncbi:MAG TPA: hypothetical protein VFQ61_16050 [Polyangiaceae bacterium]|nr:hypothetical protein [Polyangiaceae bacterium]
MALLALSMGVVCEPAVSCAGPQDAEAKPSTDSETLAVLILDTEDSPLARRLRQELEALGFEVDVRKARTTSLSDELREPNTIAAIEILPTSSGQINLVVKAPKSSKLIRHSLPIEAQQDPAAAELVTTRTVELLRAARLEYEQVRQRSTHSEPLRQRQELQPAPARPVSAAKHERLGPAFAAGGSVLTAPPFSPGFGGWFLVAWRTGDHWALAAEASLPLSGSTLQRTEGEVEARSSSYKLGVWLEPSREARLAIGGSAGAQLERTSFSGAARAPYTNAEAALWTWGPWLRGTTALELTTNLRVLAWATLGLSLPKTTVRVASKEITDFGRPSLNLGVGLEWSP